MKIVVLDGYTLNPGDLSWSALKNKGDVVIYDRTFPNELFERAAEAEILFTNKVQLGKELILNLPQLKYIGVLATGFNIIDIETAKVKNIVVSNVPGYSTASVVQHTFALLLEFAHHTQNHSDAVRNGKWSSSSDFCFWDYPLLELAGKTMGILGFGTIGRQVADTATAFGMNVIMYSRTRRDELYRPNFKWVELKELFLQSDVLSVHCPLTPETSDLINKNNLELMKPSAFLINTSRGPIVNDLDLANALNSSVIAGAGIDVLSTEPPSLSNPLLSARNCFITPHISWATKESRQRLMNIAINNLEAFLEGKPDNWVNR